MGAAAPSTRNDVTSASDTGQIFFLFVGTSARAVSLCSTLFWWYSGILYMYSMSSLIIWILHLLSMHYAGKINFYVMFYTISFPCVSWGHFGLYKDTVYVPCVPEYFYFSNYICVYMDFLRLCRREVYWLILINILNRVFLYIINCLF